MVNVAILGYGVVGSGVAELIGQNALKIDAAAAVPIRVKYILDIRDFPGSPFAGCFVKDFAAIENDPDVQVVVECIGGMKFAYDFTRRALLAGKHVVTSNKELVAERGDELLALTEEKNLSYLFEASVGGGIPVIRPLSRCLAANRITEICGILNGTSNYVLTAMRRGRTSFDDALAQARALGYAESDPTDDIEGHDACRKICILASLAFGKHIYPRQVHTEGISRITGEDMDYAAAHGYRIKLLGRAALMEDGRPAILVTPHMVPLENPLAMVEGVFNGIMARGNAVGDVMFYGRGAGKLPTASAVVADIIDIANHFDARKRRPWGAHEESFAADFSSLQSEWYTRPGGGLRIRILPSGEASV